MNRKSLCSFGLGPIFAIAAMLAAADEEVIAPQVGVVASVEAPAEPAAAEEAGVPGDRTTRLRFNFRFQPWGQVLDWLGKQTGLSVQLDVMPLGTFNFTDDREYTPAEAIDLLNRVLSTKGCTLVRHGRKLILINREGDVPIGPTIPTNEIRVVTPSAVIPTSRPGTSASIARWETVDEWPAGIAVFETVFWDPRDTVSLRRRIRDTSVVKGRTVLEIGTGSGLLALCCLEAGASHVTATDVNRFAIDNAAYNADLLGFSDRLDLRLVPLDDAEAYSVIGASEKFDLIISNPPWEDALPTSIDTYAYYDEGFQLLRSLLCGLKEHLRPGGKALLAYGSVDAIKNARRLADQYGVEVRLLDDRAPDRLPDVFLPGMLLEVTPR